ncbi:MAG: hypothetical protein JW994_04090 [Candidatus Omnitrophica bacterium]|nr:hypothetical protein [Candidatus Omnitrophota bacterium]
MTLTNILKSKTASVWGLGYLGYTTMLKLQNSGFNIIAYDTNKHQLRQFLNGQHPNKGQIAIWSQMNYLPKLDQRKIKTVTSPKELFKASHLHIIAIPRFRHRTSKDEDITKKLSVIFSKYLKKSKIKPLVIFESAFVPGYIEKYFVKTLEENKIFCSRDYYLGALFRTDWSMERFVNHKDKMPIGGYCGKALDMTKQLFNHLGIQTVKLGNLDEAEIYVNSVNAIQAMASDFIRQLTLGYPSVNMKRLSEVLFRDVTLEDCALNIGTGGEKMTLATDNLIRGSENPGNLTLLKEFQDINISSVLSYGEYIIRHGFKSVAILGITYKGNQKDLTLSPSITLADYLLRNSVKVSLNDPFCTKREIQRLIKGAKITDFPGKAFSAEVLIIASDHTVYKHLSQAALDNIRNKKTRLVIDNYGIWSHLLFDRKTKYHQIGDGRFNLSK